MVTTPMLTSKPYAICGAKTRSGEPCQRRQMANGRCRTHGGLTPHGIALPQTTHGRYSKYLPQRLHERYAASLADPELLAMREDIALLESRLTDLILRVDTGEAGAVWKDLSDIWRDIEMVRANKNMVGLAELLTELGQIIRRGHADYAAWGEVRAVQEQKRKLIESEQKRLVAMQQMVTAEQAMLFVSVIQDSLRRHVTDRTVLAAIAADIAALSNRDAA